LLLLVFQKKSSLDKAVPLHTASFLFTYIKFFHFHGVVYAIELLTIEDEQGPSEDKWSQPRRETVKYAGAQVAVRPKTAGGGGDSHNHARSCYRMCVHTTSVKLNRYCRFHFSWFFEMFRLPLHTGEPLVRISFNVVVSADASSAPPSGSSPAARHSRTAREIVDCIIYRIRHQQAMNQSRIPLQWHNRSLFLFTSAGSGSAEADR